MSNWFEMYGYSEVLDGLTVGAYPLDEADIAELAALGIDRVVNLTSDDEYAPDERRALEKAYKKHKIEEIRFPSEDFGALSQSYIDQTTKVTLTLLDEGHQVYLHCRAGWQRGPAIAAAIYSRFYEVPIEEALEMVAAQKPRAQPLIHQVESLQQWYNMGMDQSSGPRVRKKVTVRGRVQGVFFRQSVADQARSLGVGGWARNMPDGSLQMVFEGSEEAVEKLINYSRRGPSRARVDSVDVSDDMPVDQSDFEII